MRVCSVLGVHPDTSDPVAPWTVKQRRRSSLQPNTTCVTGYSSAVVVWPMTSSRRQINGLIPASTTRSW